MSENQQDFSAAPYRIDQQLHQILYKKPAQTKLEPKPEEVLPESRVSAASEPDRNDQA